MARLPNRAAAIDLGAGAGVIRQLGPLRPSSRVPRRPKHSFRLRQHPWVITPFMIAPVLPGETMRNLLLQARAVTDPLADKLGGWWLEYYFFYVKHRDLAARDDLVAMHVEGSAITSLNSAADLQTYHYGGAPNYVQMCLETVTEWYFRDDGEAWNATGSTLTIDGAARPLARAADRLWWDSLKLEADQPTLDSRLPGHYDDLPQHMIDAGFQTHYDQWTWMRENRLTEATFEDYLRTFGIRAEAGAKEDEHKPELIRYVRDWTYPSNTINPENGQATSACSWAVSERADKDRFFREPGFLFGVSVARPKVYFQGQLGHIAASMDSPLEWLPAVMRNDPYTSLTEEQHNAGPLNGIFNSADDYWWDQRDLLLYGDQFLNFDTTPTLQPNDFNSVALPASSGAGNIRLNYVAGADINAMFSAWDDEEGDNGLNKVRVDGVVSLNIHGHQEDHT